uniref:AVR-Pi54 n=1 Tax=Pyricularia oryzae TaxID=318829 RepID=A0A1Z2R7I2_PYROR|nr:AVR-Pi54 [Pyricularia oryzae]
MQFTATIISILATAATVLAAPVEVASATPLEARACKTVAASPSGVWVSKNAPQWVGFWVPTDAVGACELKAVFPAGFPIAGTRPQVNIIDVNGPAPGSIVGTVTFTPGTSTTINPFACRQDMQYKLEVASWQAQGSVSYPAQHGTGLILTYGC